MKISLTLAWRVEAGDREHAIEPVLFQLLSAVERGGHLHFAAQEAGVSYRYAWGLIRSWQERFGQPLLSSTRGRGASLTAAGRALLEAKHRIDAETRSPLAAAELVASDAFAGAFGQPATPLRIASSSSDLVNQLHGVLAARNGEVQLELTGSAGALRRYQRNEVDVAGFHLPVGELARAVALSLIALLDDARDSVFLLELRVLGLMSRMERPVLDLNELGVDGMRFINRQPGSGTRLALDGLLGQRGIAPGLIRGYHDHEYTHSAVAAIVASSAADVAFGTAAAAQRFGLHFVPLVQERFYLCARKDAPRELLAALAEFARDALARQTRQSALTDHQPSVKLLRRIHDGYLGPGRK